MGRCVWCGELRDRLALPEGARVCRCCVAYERKRALWYGADYALPAGIALSVATVVMPEATKHKRRRAA